MRLLYKHIILLVVLLTSSMIGNAQYIKKAYEALNADDLKNAKIFIDSAINSPEENKNAQTWRFKGFIYKKLEDINNPNLEIREEAIDAFIKSNLLDTENKYKEKNKIGLTSLIYRYYNEAVLKMKNKQLDVSEKSYELYKEKYRLILDSNFDFKESDIEYYNAFATEYSKTVQIYSHKEIGKEVDSLLNIYKKVLTLDSNNYNANFNIAIIYYNFGVELVYTLSPDLDLEELVKASRKCVEFFRLSLPFMDKAHLLNPDRLETIEGLYGIHLNLNNEEKAANFKKLMEK